MNLKTKISGIIVALLLATACKQSGIEISKNPHYFSFQGKPVILITTDHLYGAVIDQDFDFEKYLTYLSKSGMNMTRIYPGGMFVRDGKYKADNPLAPEPGRQLLPWAKSDQSGANSQLALPGQPSYKYDLTKWNPEYFGRLKAFVEFARKKNLIVEVAFFNGMYADCWPLMAMYHTNNIQNVGNYEAVNCGSYTMKDSLNIDVIPYQQAYITKITNELNDYENVIFDICDEPSLQGMPDGSYILNADSLVIPWLQLMADAFVKAEESLPNKHIFGQTVQSQSPDLSNQTWCKWLPTEYVTPAGRALSVNYSANKPIVDVESNYFANTISSSQYDADDIRAEGWWFLLGGGAGCINLNGEFYRGNETGSEITQKQIIPQKNVLKQFMYSLDFVNMSRFTNYSGTPENAFSNAIAEEGKQYACYLFHGKTDSDFGIQFIHQNGNYSDTLIFNDVLTGKYSLSWIQPETGAVISTEKISWKGGDMPLITPSYTFDIALKLLKQ